MLRYWKLIRNTPAYREILRDFNGGHPTHAYLLESRDGKIAEEYALLIAMAAHCTGSGERPCFTCRACRNTAERVHPDVRILPEKGERLSVEEASDLISDAQLRGIESENKVYIIKNASAMLPIVQNKLLKTIEEPPRGVTVVMLAENEANILVTIRSRMKKVEIPGFPMEHLAEFLVEKYGDEEKCRAIAVCADGLAGRAEEMASSDGYYAMYLDMFRLFSDFSDSRTVLEKSLILSRYKDHLPEALSLMQLVLRDALMKKTAPELVRAKHRDEDLEKIAALYPQAALISAIGKIDEARKKLFYNCNTTAVIDMLLFDILEERAKCRLS